jgi:hypothetical protein
MVMHPHTKYEPLTLEVCCVWGWDLGYVNLYIYVMLVVSAMEQIDHQSFGTIHNNYVSSLNEGRHIVLV